MPSNLTNKIYLLTCNKLLWSIWFAYSYFAFLAALSFIFCLPVFPCLGALLLVLAALMTVAFLAGLSFILRLPAFPCLVALP